MYVWKALLKAAQVTAIVFLGIMVGATIIVGLALLFGEIAGIIMAFTVIFFVMIFLSELIWG